MLGKKIIINKHNKKAKNIDSMKNFDNTENQFDKQNGQTEKRGGGSHQRDTNKAILSAINAKNLKLNCKCPIHYNDGKGTEIDASNFNRCSKSSTGYQGMCASGKTEIDSFSHKLKRILTIASFSSNMKELNYILEKIFDDIDSPIKKNIIDIINKNIKFSFELDDDYQYIYNQYIEIYKNYYNLNEITNLSLKNFFILSRIKILESKLKSKSVGLYTSKINLKDFQNINKKLLENTNKIKLEENIDDKIKKLSTGFFIVESKDGENKIFYDADSMSINFSKLNDLYFSIEGNYKKSKFKLNLHNTKEKGQRTSSDRAYSYLADGDFIEANRYMRDIGQNNKKIHADHMIALRIGGIHDISNLSPLSDYSNLKKKDKLIESYFEKLKENINLLSEYHREKFIKYVENGYNIKLIEVLLKKSVEEQIEFIKKMSYNDKIIYLKNKYPYLNNNKLNRIIRKYF